MQTRPTASSAPAPRWPEPPLGDPLREVMHRWFVQYNPLYLSSAALVLAGLWLVSRAAAEQGSVLGQLGVAAIAELYALALIAAAALLTRMRLRRPAAMLGLLAVIYQCDVTLHVETCSFLGSVGWAAAAAWAILFPVKLHALARALELRASPSAIVVPTAGALGVALLPQLFRDLDPQGRTTLTALFVFAIGAAWLWTSRGLRTGVDFDVRARRAVRGAWAIVATLGLGHVLYWIAELGVEPVGLLPVAVLLATRWARDGRTVWTTALAALGGSAVLDPASLSTTAWMVAAALALRALRSPVVRSEPPATAAVPPYRGLAPLACSAAEAPAAAFARAERGAMVRLCVGAAWSVHLALWTHGWSGGAWPAHGLALDAILIAGCLAAAWKVRRAATLAPALVTAAHLSVELGWLAAPRGVLQWGLTTIGLGFALLANALLISRWQQRRSERAEEIAGAPAGLTGTARGCRARTPPPRSPAR